MQEGNEKAFSEIVKNLDDTYFFDNPDYYKLVQKTPYELYTKDGFGILIEYKKFLWVKIGHSRGGVRFDKKTKSLDEYKAFIANLKEILKAKGYAYIGIDHVSTSDKFTTLFPKEGTNFRTYFPKTAIINVQKDWISKFNSKKKYNLLYASKKGITLLLYSNVLEEVKDNQINMDLFYALVEETIHRHSKEKKNYSLPSKEEFQRIFKHMKYILAVGEFGGKWLAFSLVLLNDNGDIASRLHAGANQYGLNMRVPSYLEVSIVDKLAELGIKKYDLWGILPGKQHEGYSDFKRSIADEVVKLSKYSIVKIDNFSANILIYLTKLKRKITPLDI